MRTALKFDGASTCVLRSSSQEVEDRGRRRGLEGSVDRIAEDDIKIEEGASFISSCLSLEVFQVDRLFGVSDHTPRRREKSASAANRLQ